MTKKKHVREFVLFATISPFFTNESYMKGKEVLSERILEPSRRRTFVIPTIADSREFRTSSSQFVSRLEIQLFSTLQQNRRRIAMLPRVASSLRAHQSKSFPQFENGNIIHCASRMRCKQTSSLSW